MQTATAPSEILLRLPESVRVALGAYMEQQQEPLETIIEQAIVNFLDGQTQLVQAQEEDPAVLAFLKFLEKDITENPERLQSFSPEWVKSAFESIEGVEVNLDLPLEDEED